MPNSKSKVLPLPVGEVIKALSSERYNKSKHSSWTRFNVGKLIIEDKGNVFIKTCFDWLKKLFSASSPEEGDGEGGFFEFNSLPNTSSTSYEFIMSKFSIFSFWFFSSGRFGFNNWRMLFEFFAMLVWDVFALLYKKRFFVSVPRFDKLFKSMFSLLKILLLFKETFLVFILLLLEKKLLVILFLLVEKIVDNLFSCFGWLTTFIKLLLLMILFDKLPLFNKSNPLDFFILSTLFIIFIKESKLVKLFIPLLLFTFIPNGLL